MPSHPFALAQFTPRCEDSCKSCPLSLLPLYPCTWVQGSHPHVPLLLCPDLRPDALSPSCPCALALSPSHLSARCCSLSTYTPFCPFADQCWIQDFPDGARTPEVEAPAYYLVKYFPKNCIKINEIGTRGTWIPGAPFTST